MPTGTFFDGNVAHPQPVTFEFTAAETLRVTGENLDREFALRDIRVSDRLGDVPRFVYLPTGATIESTGNDAIDAALHQRRRGRAGRCIHFLESHRAIAAIGCVLLLFGFGALIYFGPPRLARIVAHRVPAELDRRMGDLALTSIRPYFANSSLAAPERERVFTQLRRLRPDAPSESLPKIVFWSMNGGLPNAFALPGNTIVITDELMRLPVSDDEIAAVLAHECGHLDHRHGLQGLLRQSFALLIVTAATGDLSTLTSFAAAIPVSILTKGYSRDLEREADRYALALLRDREINPQAFVTVLTKLDARHADQQRNSTYLSTHPATEERAALFGGISPEARDAVLAEPILADARRAAQQNDHATAIHYYNRALALTPTAEIYLLRARSHFARQDWTAADSDLAKVIELNPQSAEPHARRADIAVQTRNFDAAIDAAEKARALDPKNSLALAILGHAKFVKGDAEGAMAFIDEAIEVSPDDYRGWAYRAAIKERQKDFAGAEADFNQALRRAPDEQQVRYGRGMLRIQQRNYAGGLEDLNQVTDERLWTADYFFRRGIAYRMTRQRDQAIADLSRALGSNPPKGLRVYIHLNRGLLHIDQSAFRSAIFDFNTAIELAPERGDLYLHRAYARHGAGDAHAALADLELAEEKGAPETPLRRLRSQVHSDLGNHEESTADLDAIIATAPTARAYFTRALNYYHLGDWEHAENDLNSTIERGGAAEQYAHFFRLLVRRHRGAENPENEFAAAIAEWREGWPKTIGNYLLRRIDEAELLREAETGTHPSPDERRCEAYYYIAETYLLSGDEQRAAEYFQKCVEMNITSFVEHNLAKAHLRTLRKN